MPRLYLVRHAEAAAAWAEDPDPGLSIRGREQARTVADALLKLGAKPVLTSPMRRARETAEALASRWGVYPEAVDEIGEVPTPPSVAIADRGAWLRDLMNADWASVEPEVAAWRAALLDTLRGIRGDTVLFTHFMAINAVVAEAEGYEQVVTIRPGNGSVTVVEVDGQSLAVYERGAQANSVVL